jgi:anthranilate/para-aminobenzoate synthase component II
MHKFDGLFLSNGPGDPTMCDFTIKELEKVVTCPESEIKPIFGICLGNQLMGLAAGERLKSFPSVTVDRMSQCSIIRQVNVTLPRRITGITLIAIRSSLAGEHSLPTRMMAVTRVLLTILALISLLSSTLKLLVDQVTQNSCSIRS